MLTTDDELERPCSNVSVQDIASYNPAFIACGEGDAVQQDLRSLSHVRLEARKVVLDKVRTTMPDPNSLLITQAVSGVFKLHHTIERYEIVFLFCRYSHPQDSVGERWTNSHFDAASRLSRIATRPS